MGWSNVQFVQNSPTGVFVAQGNDIIGSVLITDSNGTKHTINGFVKWRTPSGNSPSTLVFSPSQSVTLATNSANGSATYTLDDTKYIGLTFNGSTITIANDGSVSGNAATNGLLDALNAYLALQPKINIANASTIENSGSVNVTVTLSTASTSIVTVKYATLDGTALAGTDYVVPNIAIVGATKTKIT